MRSIIAIGLLFAMLFVAGFAHAAIIQSGQSPATVGQSDGATCLNPVTVTTTTSQLLFEGPKLGWVTVPAEKQALRCCQAIQ